jgi:hypothetical protein
MLDAYNNSIYVDELLSGDYEALFRILEDSTRASVGSRGVQNCANHEGVALRAYEIYVERGREDGNDVQDWLRAEQEVLEKSQREARRAIIDSSVTESDELSKRAVST